MNPVIQVLLADDHPIVRSGLRQAIDAQPDMRVVAEVDDGWDVLHHPPTWDVLVLDISLPRLSGIEVLRRLRAERPGARVLVLSMYAEDQFAHRLREEGAAAYLQKSARPEEVIAALRQIVAGGRYQRPPAAPKGEGRPHARLSARENQVFLLLLQGRSQTEIAAELAVSGSTVNNHVAHIKDKLGARSVPEIISYAHRVGLI